MNHPHAVTKSQNVLITNNYQYDANGNMTDRDLGSKSYDLAYDHESRLVDVDKDGNQLEQYSYDGDGARVKVVSGNTTTVYIGDYYEYQVTGSASGEEEDPDPTPTTRKYYYAGSQRLAVRDSQSGLTMLYGDHLGSASVAVTSSGALQRMRYKPWGEARGTSPAAFPTDRLFTGQIYDGSTASGGTGLYFYNARYYDPALGRFAQADTIVPDPANPMAFDRYAYVYNNPLKYTDPSGHCAIQNEEHWNACQEAFGLLGFRPDGWQTWGYSQVLETLGWLRWGISFTNSIDQWTTTAIGEVIAALNRVDYAFGQWGVSTRSALGRGLTFGINLRGTGGGCNNSSAPGCYRRGSNFIIYQPRRLAGGGESGIETLIHEMGHYVDWRMGSGTDYWSRSGDSDWHNGWIRRTIPGGGTQQWTPVGAKVSSYAFTSPMEDFAETFVVAVEFTNRTGIRGRRYLRDRVNLLKWEIIKAFPRWGWQ